MELFTNNFGLRQLIGHLNDGANHGLHLRVIQTIKIFVAAALSTGRDLNGNSIPVGCRLDQILRAAHQLSVIDGRAL